MGAGAGAGEGGEGRAGAGEGGEGRAGMGREREGVRVKAEGGRKREGVKALAEAGTGIGSATQSAVISGVLQLSTSGEISLSYPFEGIFKKAIGFFFERFEKGWSRLLVKVVLSLSMAFARVLKDNDDGNGGGDDGDDVGLIKLLMQYLALG